MSDSQPASANRAVFLSYASQDAAAAQRICEALRAAGVEVWFDQNELVGGDAWDAKIRKQIADCALFVPIISANTQARLEGYFRIEWKLAAQRTHAMAEAKPFLLPVVIDSTRDAEAHLPTEFKAVQWTRLPGGEAPLTFCARVKKLLGGEVAVVGSELGSSLVRPQEDGRGPAASLRQSSRSWLVPAALCAATLIAVALWQPWRAKETVPPASLPVASVPAKPLTEAQQLVAKARKILDEGDEFNRETYVLAEELLKKSEALDLTDASAWSLHAELSSRMFQYGLDYSPARREALQSQADRAAKLAPGTTEAEIALAYAQVVTRQDISGLQQRLTKLADKFPNNSHLNRVLSFAGMWNEDVKVATAATQRALKSAPDDPEIKADLFYVLVRHSKYAEAEQAMRGALTGRRTVRLWSVDWILKLTWRGDIDGAVEAVEQYPSWNLAEDRGCSEAAMTYLWARKPSRMFGVLSKFPRDYLRSSAFYGPRAVLTAWAHEAARENEAALADWRTVAQLADRELANTPDDVWAMHWKAWALARLGDRDSARKILRILEERNADISNGISKFIVNFAGLALVADSKDEAIARLTRYVASGETSALGKLRPVTRAMLLVNPLLESLQGDPRFEALVAKAPGPEENTTAPVAVSSDDKSVAVLAFADDSPGRDSEYFSDGISEELINALGKVPGLKVPARTSSFHFKGKDTPIPEIAKQLGVAYVIEGSVQRLGDKVKISARLSKAADGFQEWNDSFTRDAKDVFAVEEEIAGLIAKRLSLKLGVSSAAAIASVKPEAFELYVQGRQAWNLRTDEGFSRAETLLTKAIELEPNFARAHSAIADVWSLRGQLDNSLSAFGLREGPDVDRVAAKCELALRLDPRSSEAHASFGILYWNVWRFADSERELREAIRLNANYASAHQWLGRTLMMEGRLDEALSELKQATELDPLSPRILDNYAWALIFAGRLSEAIAFCDRALALQSTATQAAALKAVALAEMGRLSEAAELARALSESDTRYSMFRVIVLGRAGKRAEVESSLRIFAQGSIISKVAGLAALNRYDDALAAFDPAWIVSSRADYLLFHPVFDPMRGDPHFQKNLATLGLTEAHDRAQAWRKAHPPEMAVAK